MTFFPDTKESYLHLYWISLETFSGWERETRECLEESEWQRAERFFFRDDRRRWILSRFALRRILSRYSRISPLKIRFRIRDGGKPELDLPPALEPLYFNLSHSGERMLLGVSSFPGVGVDTEIIKPMRNLLDLTERFFASGEADKIRTASPEDRTNLFYRIWTRKEACIKATGEGLSRKLDSFEVSLEEEGRALLWCSQPNWAPLHWHLGEILPEKSYVGAWCAEKKPENFSFLSLVDRPFPEEI